MKQSTEDQAKGKMQELAGSAKEKMGRATNNPRLTAEGSKPAVSLARGRALPCA